MSMPSLPNDWWPVAQVGMALDYSFSVARDLGPVNDVIQTVSGSAMPSGTGELVINSLSVVLPFSIALNLSGGVAGRLYIVQLVVNTVAGRTFPYLIGLQMAQVLADCPLPPAPSPGFGTPVVWPAAS